MTYKPKRILGSTLIITLAFVLFMAAIPRPVSAQSGDWADPDCQYRRKLTFKSTSPTMSLSDFPILVKLTSSRIDYGKTSATDIRFYDGNTLLSKETELWNDASGNSYVWVNVPSLDTSGSDYIYAYYGSKGASNPDTPSTLWSNYAMVQHLEETSGTTATDSSPKSNDGTISGGLVQQFAGQIGYANNLPDGANAYISIPDTGDKLDFGTSSFSYMFWFLSRAAGTGLTQTIFDKHGGVADALTPGYMVTLSADTTKRFSASLGDSASPTKHNIRVDTGGSSPGWGTSQWTLLTVVVDRSQQKMFTYLNGANMQTTVGTISSVLDTSDALPLLLGKNVQPNLISPPSDRWFRGALDEVRVSISGVVWSPDWAKADYLSTADNLMTYGSEESAPSRTIESCDSGATKLDKFNVGQTVFVYGGGYPLPGPTTFKLHIVQDVATWTDGKLLSELTVVGSTTIQADSSGNISPNPTSAWTATAVGTYDIFVDVNNNNRYDSGIDALDDLDVGTAGFFVIPEYAVGTILALAMCFGGVFVYRRYKHNKLKPF